MINRNIRITILLLLPLIFENGIVLRAGSAFQDTVNVPQDWFLRDPETDSLLGVSAEKTYTTLLAGKPSRTVLVAVIDSGIDIEHEDLKDIIWTNDREIPGNGLDEDRKSVV